MTTPVTGFRDFFSAGAAGYARYRPSYPGALFDWLASLAPDRELAWDCATGNGQAAVPLAARFARVIATDASAGQLAHARRHPRVEYRVARAEASGLADASIALVTVGQALHWLDHPRFFAEAARVARPGGIVAAWCYNVLAIEPALDAIVRDFYRGTLADWWTPERALVDDGYRSVAFPFAEVTAPPFAMESEWTLPDLLGYFRSWSAVTRYMAAGRGDPVAELEPRLARAWGEPLSRRRVRWPLSVRAGRVDRETTPGPPT
jgi:SAM-dependent methyltransferase